jgi:gamma-glutamylcyclotransferase (GGCT)/AIG2-like uncharacterized protein YtfP
MSAPSPTELFVYGTLRHDQPEHAMYCRGVTGWRPARLHGRLFRIVEGYLLLVLPPAGILHRATPEPEADEAWRRVITPAGLARADAAMEQAAGGGWIDGEMLAFGDAVAAWPSLDYWEGASTSGHSVYARVVVPVHTGDPTRPLVAAWVYAATRAPVGAVEVTPSLPL